ncbi:MAG: RHS repeat-associated core domain-containing protein [Phycisphaerales bacterium]
MTSASKSWDGTTPLLTLGQQYLYTFDAIGNRTQAKVMEPGSSSLDRVWDYTVDKLNRYTSVDGPRRLDVMGYTTSGAASLVYTGAASPGLSGTLQPSSTAGPFFRVLPDWSGTGIVAEVGTLNSVDKSLYLPPKPETLSYDADGNLTGDGRFTYTYDGENRLIRVEKAVGIPVAPGLGIDGVWYYEYDYLGRRIRKLRRTIVIEEMMTMNNMSGEGGNEGGGETNSLGGGGEMGEMGPIVEELRFMYDGWVLMEELSGTNAVVRSYVHGPDLSSSLGGAGGIGGTAFQVDAATASSTNTRWFTFDPQGNVTDLRSVSDNSRWATMEYGPFGEPLIGAGTNGDQFKLRFSGKYFDEETGFNYFGYRYYNASTGRWVNRDPIEERGGANCYAMVRNNPVYSIDILGLMPAACPCKNNQKDLKKEINAYINDSLKTAKTPAAVRAAIEKSLIGGGGGLVTGIENWLNTQIAGKVLEGTQCRCPVKMFVPAAPSIKLCGKCVGTDRVGHFFEEGLIYFDISVTLGKGDKYAKAWGDLSEGLVPSGMDGAMWDWFNETNFEYNFAGTPIKAKASQIWTLFGDEIAGQVLDPNGAASPADLAANSAGMEFWKQIMKGTLTPGGIDICDFVNDEWSHQTNPNKPGAKSGTPFPPRPK